MTMPKSQILTASCRQDLVVDSPRPAVDDIEGVTSKLPTIDPNILGISRY